MITSAADTAKEEMHDLLLKYVEVRRLQGERAAQEFVAIMISGLSAMLTTHAVSFRVVTKTSKEEILNLAYQRFADVKLMLCNALSSGVSAAMVSFTHHNIEYYATLKTVPEPKNKELC